MQSAYIPVLIYAVLVIAFPAVTLVLAKFIRPASTSVGAKLKPYECGIPPESDSRGRYSVRFYIVAMLFVIFDVETMFLIPCHSLQRLGRDAPGPVCPHLDGRVPRNPAGRLSV